MPLREIIGKSIGFGLVSAACVGGGFLVFYGPHAYNDYFNTPLALLLILLGLGVGGLGTFLIVGIIVDARLRQREAELHITPRPGPLAPPPPWGMADVGRPGAGTVRDSQPRGGGGPRVMSVALSNLDAPILIAVLVIWTIGFCIWLAPR
jgi:hypothetical protein